MGNAGAGGMCSGMRLKSAAHIPLAATLQYPVEKETSSPLLCSAFKIFLWALGLRPSPIHTQPLQKLTLVVQRLEHFLVSLLVPWRQLQPQAVSPPQPAARSDQGLQARAQRSIKVAGAHIQGDLHP